MPRASMRAGPDRCRFSAVNLIGLIVPIALLAVAPAAVDGAPDTASAPKAEILGLWKGASVCAKVPGNEFCHDETVVLNFVDVPTRPATVALKAARVVDGTLIRTYDLYFNYRPEDRKWSCEFDQAQVRAIWEYVVSGDGMTGTASLLPEKTVVRTVTASRTRKDEVLESRR